MNSATRRTTNLALTSIVALLLTGAPAFADRGADVTAAIAKAHQELAEGNLKAAEIRLKNAMRDDPGNLDARIELGQVYLWEGAPQAAEAAFNGVLEKGGDPLRVVPLLGESYLRQNKTRELLDRLEPQKFPAPLTQQILVLRSRAHAIQKELREAEDDLTQAIAAGGETRATMFALANLRRLKNDGTGAEEVVDRLLAKDPADFQVLQLKGELRALLGDPAGSAAAFEQILARRPADVPAQLGDASALLALGRTADARRNVDAVLQHLPNHPYGQYLRAYMLARDGKIQEAADLLEAAIGHLEQLIPAHLLLAELELRLGRVEQALTQAQQAFALDPDPPQTRRTLAVIQLRRHAPAKAIELLAPLAARTPEDATVQALLGEAYAQQGRFDLAAKALETALRPDPSNVALRTQLDASRMMAGQGEMALKDLNDLVSNQPTAERPGILLVVSEWQAGHREAALKAAEKMRANQPKSALAANLLGQIQRALGDRAAARQSYLAALADDPGFYPAAANLALLNQAENKPDEARRILMDVVTASPTNAQAMMALAGLAQAKGDADEVVAWLQKAVAAAPKLPEPRMRLVDALLYQHKPTKALDAANELAALFPDDPRALQVVGRAQVGAGQEANGLASFAHAADLLGNSALAQTQYSNLLASLNRPEEAHAALERALKIDPGFFPAWRQLVAQEQGKGGVDKALALADRAPEPLRDALKAETFAGAQRYAEADAAFAAFLASHPDASVTARRSEVRHLAGDRQGAHRLLADWLARHPADDGVRMALANQLMLDKDYPAATREYEELAKKVAGNAVILNNLAWLYGRANNPKAVVLARQAHDLAPGNVIIDDTLGWLLVQQGQPSQGLELLRTAHAQLPTNRANGFHLAAALAQSGHEQEAMAILRPLADSQEAFDEQPAARELLQKLGSKP
jgi:putative PEP-CTERM system TPR-repeat lipoprotein